jgi:tRNA nucleotidyltransferase (CCA-adding enzyme)
VREYPRSLSALDPPAEVREIVARLERAGHETWCVGGAVRDALLGHAHLDWDLATAATPPEVMRLFKRTVPVGVEFGTVGVLDKQNTMHEVTTFRRDVHTDGRHAVVEFGVKLEDDLARRDFTINAIAYHPKREEIRDPFEGQLDLERGVVRAVGTAADRMREDRLRALRAIRFAARFGFHIEPETWTAIVESAPHLGRLSPERVRQELEKTMEQVTKPSIALEWWRAAGALRTLVPALADAPLERFLALDFLPRAGSEKPGDDAGSPKAEGRTPEVRTPALGDRETLDRLSLLFFGDGEKTVVSATKALRFSNAHASWISALADSRYALGAEMDAAMWSAMPDDARIRRWVARVGRTRTDAFISLTAALWRARLSREPNPGVEGRLAPFAARATQIAFRDPIELADLAVDGEDLGTVGITPGPRLGKVLHALLEKVIADPALNTREDLLELAISLGDS